MGIWSYVIYVLTGRGASPPDPPNQGIQSYELFGDLEIRRSDILQIFFSASDVYACQCLKPRGTCQWQALP